MQSRYYDPELGRFINADAYASTGQGVLGNNMFAYCCNSPVSRHDPGGQLPMSIAFDLLDKWLLGRGEAQYFDEESDISQKLKKSDTMKEEIKKAIEKYKGGEEYANGTVIFNSDEPDLWLGIRRANYEFTITEKTEETGWWIFKKTETIYVVDVKVFDTYNFNVGDEQGDGLGSILNNFGYWAQELNMGMEYYWEATYVYTISEKDL